MKKEAKGLVAGLILGSMLTGGFVYAKTGMQNISVTYDNIKVYKDNVLCELKDSNGSVIEPFIYNGTTYMPVRGTANLADMQVTWDGNAKSVYLWDSMVPNGTSFIDVCPPYDTTKYDTKVYTQSSGRNFSMAGKKYSEGITLGYYGAYALFNLDSKYSTIECTVGHTGKEQYNKRVSFFVDGRLVKEIELEAECMPKTVSIPVSYGLQLKILANSSEDGYNYGIGIGNMTVN